MHDETPKDLAEILSKADESILVEIVREAELFLESQLTSALAADQRALTFAGVMAAAIALIAGALISLVTAGMDAMPVLTVAGIMLAGFILALLLSVYAYRPTEFGYRGNNPKHWADDVLNGTKLSVGLAGQAFLYAKSIAKNTGLLKHNSTVMWGAIWAVVAGLIGGVGAAAIYALKAA